MSAGEYTPGVDSMRLAWRNARAGARAADEEFDRFITRIRREEYASGWGEATQEVQRNLGPGMEEAVRAAKEEAWEEGRQSPAADLVRPLGAAGTRASAQNPYTLRPKPLNPECRDGKHRNCDSRALDLADDELTACGCDCHEGGGA